MYSMHVMKKHVSTIQRVQLKKVADGRLAEEYENCNQWNLEFVFDDHKKDYGIGLLDSMSRKDVAVLLMELATEMIIDDSKY